MGNDFGHTSIGNARAKGAGLGFRPIATTVRDTLAWWPTVQETRRNAPRFALTAEQEATVLAALEGEKELGGAFSFVSARRRITT